MASLSFRHLFLGFLAISFTSTVFIFYHNPGMIRLGLWLKRGVGRTTAPPPARPPLQRTNTIIVSSWRSGSSFLGQVFNQHPEVFFVMEPLKHVWMAMPRSSESKLRGAGRDLLRSLYTCDESALEFYIGEPRLLSSVFMFDTSAALCRAPACPAAANASSGFNCGQSCSGGPLAEIGRACERNRHVVIKSVRIMDIETLRPLVADPAVRLRVIHLVRDPRAVFLSRRNMDRINLQIDNEIVLGDGRADNQSLDVEVMRRICRSNDNIGATIAAESAVGGDAGERLRKAGREGAREGYSGLSGAYMAVRYEDLVSSPEQTVREMFAFAGIELPATVTDWVQLMTQGQKDGAGPFDVVRLQSPAVARKWRWRLGFQEVRSVQNACRAAMERFHYREFKTETQLRNASIDAFY